MELSIKMGLSLDGPFSPFYKKGATWSELANRGCHCELIRGIDEEIRIFISVWVRQTASAALQKIIVAWYHSDGKTLLTCFPKYYKGGSKNY
jgi:hypothetical protein